MMTAAVDYYEVLGVSPTASDAEVKAAYHKAIRATHPDSGGTAALFRLVQEAGETLTDQQRRAEYDTARTKPPEPEAPPAAPPPPADEWVVEDIPVVEDTPPPPKPTPSPPRPVPTPARYGPIDRAKDGLWPESIREWPTWQKVLLWLGILSVPWPLAWGRVTEIVAPHYPHSVVSRVAGYVVLEPVFVLGMVAILVFVAAITPRRRWAWAAWALAWDNDIGLLVLGVCVVWTLAKWLVVRWLARRH